MIPDALALADTDADGPSYDGAYTGPDRAAYTPPDAGSDIRSEPSVGGVLAAARRCRDVRVLPPAALDGEVSELMTLAMARAAGLELKSTLSAWK